MPRLAGLLTCIPATEYRLLGNSINLLLHNPQVCPIRPNKKIAVFPLTRPTLYFCADPVIFIAIKNKVKDFHAYRPYLYSIN